MDKFCKDCKWFRLAWVDRLIQAHRYGKCAHPKARPDFVGELNSLVDGKIHTTFRYCSCVRDDSWQCGRNATWWEPK